MKARKTAAAALGIPADPAAVPALVAGAVVAAVRDRLEAMPGEAERILDRMEDVLEVGRVPAQDGQP